MMNEHDVGIAPGDEWVWAGVARLCPSHRASSTYPS